ncbi:MAG: glycosyltransferase family 2 protein [Bacteroidaceae bacterium]|nr:glycosyltransferase family 2 protein [Bacteroidaceae bacterium]
MKLSIVIVNYNVKYYLEQCLRSVDRAATNIKHEILVVDNASEDGSMEYLKPRFPHVIWIESKENGGFSHANNIGFGRASGEYILMLNPDTIVTRKALEGCVKFMDGHPETGAAGVKMINKDGTFAMESRRGIVKPWVAFCKATGLCRRYPKSRLFGHYYMSYLDTEEISSIEMVSGACMLLRRATLDKVGTLDEDFFMYWEDSDLSYRILKSGYKNYYLPYTIFHYKGESSVKSRLRYRYWLYSSLEIFFKKHFPLYHMLFYVPLRLSVALLKFRIHHANPILYGEDWESRQEPPKKFLVLGNAEACRQIKEICIANNLGEAHIYIATNEKETPEGHLVSRNTENCTHVLYDAESYSYDTMLHLLQQTPGNTLKLATYSTVTGNLITEDAIYNLQK